MPRVRRVSRASRRARAAITGVGVEHECGLAKGDQEARRRPQLRKLEAPSPVWAESVEKPRCRLEAGTQDGTTAAVFGKAGRAFDDGHEECRETTRVDVLANRGGGLPTLQGPSEFTRPSGEDALSDPSEALIE